MNRHELRVTYCRWCLSTGPFYFMCQGIFLMIHACKCLFMSAVCAVSLSLSYWLSKRNSCDCRVVNRELCMDICCCWFTLLRLQHNLHLKLTVYINFMIFKLCSLHDIIKKKKKLLLMWGETVQTAVCKITVKKNISASENALYKNCKMFLRELKSD